MSSTDNVPNLRKEDYKRRHKCQCVVESRMAYDEYQPSYDLYLPNGDTCDCEECSRVPLPDLPNDTVPCAGLCQCNPNLPWCHCILEG